MVWVKTSDDFMLDERVQAVDCCADSALRAAYEVCNRTETDGVFYLDQLMTRWSPAKGNRRRLRKAIDDLIGVGLVHRLEHAEALRRYTMAVEKEHQFGLRPVKNRHYFEILDYLEDQFSAEEKRLRKQGVRDRKRLQREKEREGMSHVTSRPPDPDPDPVPKLKINDHLIASKEREPTSTASPSTPSNVAADVDAGLWLRKQWTSRQQKRVKPAKWKPDYQLHLDSIIQKASEAKGDTCAILAAALDAFFADSEQQGFGCIPPGLDWKWDQFAGPYLEQIESEARARRIADKDAKYQRDLEAEGKKRLQQALERNPEWQQEGCTPGNSGTPMADAVAELMQSISGGKV
jgi:hypothetical protein